MQHCACNPNQSSIDKCYSQILLQFCALSSDLVFSIGHLIICYFIGSSTNKVEIFPKILGSRSYYLLTTWPGATVWKKQVAIVERTALEVTGWKALFVQLKVPEEYEETGSIQLWILDWAQMQVKNSGTNHRTYKVVFFNWSWQDFSKYQPVSKFRHLELFWWDLCTM